MSLLRRAIERLARGKTFRRRLPEQFGRRPIIVSPDAALRYLRLSHEAFEPELLDVVSEWVAPGDVVWDIGSNLGVFAIAAAHYVGAEGKVLAVEADTWLASVITRSCHLAENRDLPIEILSAAASSDAGVARFEIAARGRASNSLAEVEGRSTSGGARESHLVPTLPLDRLVEVTGPPKVVKIDVEGAELLVLDGAHQLLAEHRPLFYIEVAKEKSEEAAEKFKEADYVLLDPALPPAERTPIDRCPFNTLAMPRERYERTG